MKKYVTLVILSTVVGLIGCVSSGKDNATFHPELNTTAQTIVVRPTESTLLVDTNTWVEGVSYEGSELFGISFFENRFVSPTLLGKEGYDAYTLDAINDAIQKSKSDSFQVVKTEVESFVFPSKYFAIYGTYKVSVKGHPVKYKFLGPVSEAKADEVYSRGINTSGLALDGAATPLYPSQNLRPECCKK